MNPTPQREPDPIRPPRRPHPKRADYTEERAYSSATSGGFGVTDFARRVDAAGAGGARG
ncbi:hypothetical protein GA0115260_105011, partial [Streptomyces sp. MnatMP-M27]